MGLITTSPLITEWREAVQQLQRDLKNRDLRKRLRELYAKLRSRAGTSDTPHYITYMGEIGNARRQIGPQTFDDIVKKTE